MVSSLGFGSRANNFLATWSSAVLQETKNQIRALNTCFRCDFPRKNGINQTIYSNSLARSAKSTPSPPLRGGNSKSQIRNSKQIPNSKFKCSKHPPPPVPLCGAFSPSLIFVPQKLRRGRNLEFRY